MPKRLLITISTGAALIALACGAPKPTPTKTVVHTVYTFRGTILPNQADFCGTKIKIDLRYSLIGIYQDPDGCEYEGQTTPTDHTTIIY